MLAKAQGAARITDKENSEIKSNMCTLVSNYVMQL